MNDSNVEMLDNPDIFVDPAVDYSLMPPVLSKSLSSAEAVPEKFKARLHAREILDSRGSPTLEVDFITSSGTISSMVPSGASIGIHEAVELRDGGKRYNGRGVLNAAENVNKLIAKKIHGMDCRSQRDVDNILCALDGTNNKSKLGANAVLGASMACCRAAAALQGIPLYRHISKIVSGGREPGKFIIPVPSFNVINGGKHAGNNLAIQEFMIMPIEFKTFRDALRAGSETYHALRDVIRGKYGVSSINVGDEGGFAPMLEKASDALDLIVLAIKKAGYNGRIKIALDCAASEFYSNGIYALEGKQYVAEQLMEYYGFLLKKYPIVSIEDPFYEESIAEFSAFTKRHGRKVQVVGDDLLCTNTNRIINAMEHNACNALLLKLNQIGTVSEGIDAALLAKKGGWAAMVSHRSGETEDSFIADLAVGIGAPQIKSGAPCRSERLSKYNELLRIEEELGSRAVYAGRRFRRF